MFSNPLDPPSLKAARALEASYIAKWIAERRAQAPKAAAATEQKEQVQRLEGPGMAGAAAAAA